MDVKKLIEEPSGHVRSILAAKIARDYREGHYNAAESGVAADIFRILLRDIEKTVRAAMAEQLAHCPQVPRDIVLKLANDEPDVAAHVLEHSFALGEDDLIAIVRTTREMLKLRAVARRREVPARLSRELIETHLAEVMQDLFANRGAAFNGDDLLQSWEFISGRPALLEALVHHGGLPVTVAEKLYFAVSEELKYYLSRHYKLHAPAVHKAAADAREWQTLKAAAVPEGAHADDEEVEFLVEDMQTHGRLTSSFLIRALCMGNLGVFEAGIAQLAKVPRVNARLLLMSGGQLGFGAIYEAAGLPDGFREAIRILLNISLEETEYGRVHRSDFRKRVIDRIYMEKYNLTVENMEYLLAIIGGRIASTADVA